MASAPRVAQVGPLLGRHPGRVTSQPEILSALLASDGTSIRATSPRLNPLVRTADMFVSVLRWRRAVDVVVVNVFSGRAFAVVDLITWEVRRLGKPLVVVLHGGGLPAFRDRHPGWVKRVLSRAEHVVAPSPFLARTFRDIDVPISVIPNVIRLSDYTFTVRKHPRPRLLWMRAFSETYRPWLAVEAAAKLRERFAGCLLTMAGQAGPLLEPTRELAAKLGIAENVRFAGFLDMKQKQDAFEEHDVFVTTSAVDNTPVSAIEAAAAGLPVVACDVGGLRDLFRHDESAILVEDPDQLARGVERLICEAGLAARLSTNGRRIAEAFDWAKVRHQWATLYDSVVSARTP